MVKPNKPVVGQLKGPLLAKFDLFTEKHPMMFRRNGVKRKAVHDIFS